MTTSLRTSSAIRCALADEYAFLVDTFDPRHRERQATNAMKKRLAPRQCAACGRRPPEVERLEAAHIAPLAECAETTPQNLVLLCKEPRTKPPGCHTLFDKGCSSIDEMDACRKSWTRGRPSMLRDRMLLVFQQYGPRPHQQGYLTRELTNLREQRDLLSVMTPQWHDVQLSIAEVTRRRARKDALSEALREIEKVETRFLVDGRARSRFHYERAYINLLLGNLRQAFIDFDEGRMVLAQSSAVGNRWRWAAHTVLLAQVSSLLAAEANAIRP